jgi:hypothetical protein
MTELDKLEQYLQDAGIRYKRIDNESPYEADAGLPKDFGNWPQLVVYDSAGRQMWDAICHWGSYGYEQGLLEIMGSVLTGNEDVIGYLTAQDVIERIESRV